MATGRSPTCSHSPRRHESTHLLPKQFVVVEDPKYQFLVTCVSLRTVKLTAAALSLLIVALVLNSSSSNTSDAHHHQSVARTKEGSKPSVSKYTKVQGIGFQIYTGGAPAFIINNVTQEMVPNPECVHLSSYGQMVTETVPQIQCYLGDTDAVVDVAKRLSIMKDAVESAFRVADHDPSTLKVFVAPEFYWRGIHGAYKFDDEGFGNEKVCGPICMILRQLQEFTAQEKFEDWLFLFGSVVAYQVLPQEDTFDYLFYNFAPVYKGYDPSKMSHSGKRFLLPKRYVSSSDFLTPSRNLNASLFEELIGDDAMKHRDNTVRNPFNDKKKRYGDQLWTSYKKELTKLGYTMIEYDWLMVDSLSVSLEICFDHQMRTALNTYLGDMVTGRGTYIPSSSDSGLSYTKIPEYQAQISIVSSAGMTVTADSLALINNGVIFLQDGLSDAPNHQFVSTDECDLGIQFEGGSEALHRKVVMTNTDVSFQYEWLPDPRSYSLRAEVQLEHIFSTKAYPPKVNVFEAVNIAKVNRY